MLKNRKNEADDGISKKHRQRLSYEQARILEQEFQKQSDWSKQGILKALSRRLGLPKSKIYKWNWDRKRKELQNQAPFQPSMGCKGSASTIEKAPFRITIQQRRARQPHEEATDSEPVSSDDERTESYDSHIDKECQDLSQADDQQPDNESSSFN